MTNTLSFDAIAEQLAQAKADFDLAARLKTAADRIKQLTPLYDEAKAAHDAARIAAEGKTRQDREAAEKALADARFAGLADLEIIEQSAPTDPHVLKSKFRISYTRPVWDGHASRPHRCCHDSLESVPHHVLSWIVQRQFERIPASIMALSPNDPAGAIDAYLAAKARGYLNS